MTRESRIAAAVLALLVVVGAAAVVFFMIGMPGVEPDDEVMTSPPPPLAPPPGETAEAPGLRVVDEILASLTDGNIVYNTPPAMNLNDTATIRLVLGVDSTIDELVEAMDEAGEIEAAAVKVSDRMEAQLTGRDFSITPVLPEVQAVSRAEATEWRWEIRPLAHGPRHLNLALFALIQIEGESTPRRIEEFSRTIEVQVTLVQRAWSFVSNNWDWLWAATLAPMVGWFWRQRRRRAGSTPDEP